MKVKKVLMLAALITLTVTTLTFTVSALNAGNIDLVYYNATTHKPIYEVQFLTVPLAYETGKTPKIIMYGAGTNFNIQVTNYESSKGGVIVKLVNVYDGTERVVGWLNKEEVTKEFTISNLYPGYWKIVIAGTDGLPTWDISSATAPTNAGPHEIQIVGSPKLVIALLNPSRNITIGDYARLRIEVKGLYGTTNVNVVVRGQHELNYSKVLGGANGNVWTLNVSTDKLGIGKCEVIVKAMGVTGSLSFNVVPVRVNITSNVSKNASVSVNISRSESGKMKVNATNESVNASAGKPKVNASNLVNMTKVKKTNATKNASVNRTENVSATANKTVNKANKTGKIKTPGFEGVIAILGLSAVVLLRKFKF